MATIAAAFSGNAYKATFVRSDHSAMHSTTLISPLLFKNNGPLSRLSMSNDDESDSSDDRDEWNALIAAFQMYRAAYGDLRVPLRFIVPSMPPWPSKLTSTRCPCIPRPYMRPSHSVPNSLRFRTLMGHEAWTPRGGYSFDWKVHSKQRGKAEAPRGHGLLVETSHRCSG